jgi:hypothetical protein
MVLLAPNTKTELLTFQPPMKVFRKSFDFKGSSVSQNMRND